MKPILTLLLSPVLCSCLNPDLTKPYIQFLGGETQIDNTDKILQQTSSGTVEFEFSDQPVFGLVQQVALNQHKDRWVDLGVETGALFSWENDRESFNSSGGATVIVYHNEMLMIDAFVGVYAAMPFFRERLRLFISAGPMLLYGNFETETEDDNTGITYRDDDDSLSVGLYARAGAEFRIFEGGYLGAGVRTLRTEMDFDTLGHIDIEATQYFLSYSFQF